MQQLEPPVFDEASYGFALTEHVDGNVERVLLGAVRATDPGEEALRYEHIAAARPGLGSPGASAPGACMEEPR